MLFRVAGVMKNTVHLGFLAIILIMSILAFFWLSQIKSSNEKVLDLISQYDQKIDHAHVMRDTIRERQNLLLSMLVTDDPFVLDQKIQKFYHIAQKYRLAREAMHKLPMTADEREMHNLLDKQALIAQPVNNKAADMFQEGLERKDILMVINEATRYQSKLLDTLEQFVELQKSQDEKAVMYSRQQFDDSMYWITFFGILAFSIALLVSRYVGRCVLENNRALEKATIKAEEATIQKSEFLATMSHEIRTPLTAIIGFAETTLFKEQTPEQRENAIQTIIRSGKHLLQVINDILDLSKIEANKLAVELQEFSLFELLSDVDKMIRPMANDKGLNFSINYIFPLPEKINSDQLRVKQILFNLCNNAVKFTEKGYVLINVSCDCNSKDKNIEFEVVDNGIGISEENQDMVFQAYRQADSSTTRKFGGTGLGLSLSRLLSQKMDGDLSMTSILGKGSKFKLSIPVNIAGDLRIVFNQDQVPDINQEKAHALPKGLLQGSVLLAEDNYDNQQLLLIYLRRMGVDVTVVENGKLAVEAATEKNYDLVLMDMRMPEMGGLEAIRVLRKQGFDKPIVALTANTMKEDKDACYKAGCNGFLSKPVNVTKFNATVEKFLSQGEQANRQQAGLLKDGKESEELMQKFITNVANNITDIEQFIQLQEWNKLDQLLHQLRGTGGNFGFQDISTLAEQMEHFVRAEDSSELHKLLNDLKATHEKMRSGINYH